MRIALVSMLAMTLALAGCIGGGEGSASIYVKDAPTDEFQEIHLNFTQVQVHYAGNGSEEGDGEGSMEEEGGEWITVFENAQGADIDLLAASGDASAFLGEADLDAGRYTQIRVTVQSAYGVDLDGNTTDITVSSGTVKIVRGFEVEADMETRITVDFDLDRSMVQQGNGQWRMTPVVGTTTVEVVDDASSGADVDDEGDISES